MRRLYEKLSLSCGMEASRGGALHSGFTLVEILVVLAMIGLLIAVAPALYQTAVPGVRLNGATAQLAAQLRFLRTQALTNGENTFAVLELKSGQYRLSTGTKLYKLPDGAGFQFRRETGELSEAPNETVIFFADGGSSGGTIYLAAGANNKAIGVDWLTGKVTTVPR